MLLFAKLQYYERAFYSCVEVFNAHNELSFHHSFTQSQNRASGTRENNTKTAATAKFSPISQFKQRNRKYYKECMKKVRVLVACGFGNYIWICFIYIYIYVLFSHLVFVIMVKMTPLGAGKFSTYL